MSKKVGTQKFKLYAVIPFITFFLILFAFSNSAFCRADGITVGSFNLEWLGHGNEDRTDEEIKTLARYIRSLEIDVLCVQEVNPPGDVTGNGIEDWTDLLRELNVPSNHIA